MIKIIDTSVAIKWFMDEEEQEKALCFLEELKEDPREFAVPELFFNEMLAVFCRLLTDSAQIQDYLNTLQDLGMERLGNGRATLTTAAELAKQFHLSGYDAIYVANAKLVEGVWITADAAAHRKIASLKLSQEFCRCLPCVMCLGLCCIHGIRTHWYQPASVRLCSTGEDRSSWIVLEGIFFEESHSE